MGRSPRAGHPWGCDADQDIVCRRWLLIDTDPVRPSGIASVDAEHQAALGRAEAIARALAAEGWPEPVRGDRGNGGHLLYRIDLPAEDGGLVQRCLEALAARFDDGAVKVDRTAFNAARVWKRYGTVAGKGDAEAAAIGRPHRMSRILSAPDPVAVVPRDLLEALAATAPVAAKPAPKWEQRRPAGGRDFDLGDWIRKHGLDVAGPEDWRSKDGQLGRRWVFSVCPVNGDHTDRSAFSVQFASGGVDFGCHHSGCRGRDWHAPRDLVEPGWRDRHKQDGAKGPAPGKQGGDGDDPYRLGPLTLRPRRARRTAGGKLTVPITVGRNGAAVDRFQLTEAANSRREAARLLGRHLEDAPLVQKEIGRVPSQILADAGEGLDAERGRAGNGPTLEAIVRERVPAALQLHFRTERGLWSEARVGQMTRGDFVTYAPGWLREAAAGAVDAPRDQDGAIKLTALLREIEAEMRVLWCDLLERVSRAEGARLGQVTEAARRFRAAMMALWTAPRTFEVVTTVGGTSGEVASRASLASQVRTQARPILEGPAGLERRERWREVQRAYAAWWRRGTGPDGEVRIYLAMRAELGGQVGVDLPGVVDQGSLTAIGERLGVIDPAPGVSARLSGGSGGRHLAVLIWDLTRELLAAPLEDDPEPSPNAAEGVTEAVTQEPGVTENWHRDVTGGWPTDAQ
jgi:hypothetical protein